MPKIMVDGWFGAQHLKMKYPEDDVPLADGYGFMVTDAPYKAHLAVALESYQVTAFPAL